MQGEFGRYVINGLFATGVHFCVLAAVVRSHLLDSAGIANVIAAVFGITVSFFGSRYFVFQKQNTQLIGQAIKFAILYAFIALLHGAVLFVWTDKLGLDYRIGFLMATALQFVLSYSGNKIIVFRS